MAKKKSKKASAKSKKTAKKSASKTAKKSAKKSVKKAVKKSAKKVAKATAKKTAKKKTAVKSKSPKTKATMSKTTTSKKASPKVASKTATKTATPARRPMKIRKASSTQCSMPGCTQSHHAKGLCKSHYSRLRRRGSLGGSTSTKNKERLCEIAGCINPAKVNRRCSEHAGDDGTHIALLRREERLMELRRRYANMRKELDGTDNAVASVVDDE